jgi:hypothetical protein
MVQTKEQKAVYMKKYREKNKDKISEEKKKHYQEHKEEIKEYNQTPAAIKARIIAYWKLRGLIHPDYDELYELYLNCKHCEVCRKEFIDSFDKCMDHCHETGLFRQILCRSCNTRDSWKNK